MGKLNQRLTKCEQLLAVQDKEITDLKKENLELKNVEIKLLLIIEDKVENLKLYVEENLERKLNDQAFSKTYNSTKTSYSNAVGLKEKHTNVNGSIKKTDSGKMFRDCLQINFKSGHP